MNIGIIGYGGVGKAFIRLLEEKNIKYKIKFILKSNGGIGDKDGLNIEEIISKEDNIQESYAWRDGLTLGDVIDYGIDYLIELTPTNIETGEPALSYIKLALGKGINVVTGNKGPILIDYKGLKKLAEENKVFLGIGCTTGGALPSISGGVVGCAGSDIQYIEGILNGTTNFILKEMNDNRINYEEALKRAQKLGIAETNPYLDVEGYDTAIKMIILANALMDGNISLKDAEIKGITKLSEDDFIKARKEECKIKLIGKVYREGDKIKVKVAPEYVRKEHNLFNVEGKNKGVSFYTDSLGDITIFGGASGMRNAAASILRDIINFN